MREQLRQNALTNWNHYQTMGLHVIAEEAEEWVAELEAAKHTTTPEFHG